MRSHNSELSVIDSDPTSSTGIPKHYRGVCCVCHRRIKCLQNVRVRVSLLIGFELVDLLSHLMNVSVGHHETVEEILNGIDSSLPSQLDGIWCTMWKHVIGYHFGTNTFRHDAMKLREIV